MLSPKIAAAAIITVLPFAAIADQTQWYFGAAAGLSGLHPDSADTGAAVADDGAVGYKLMIGTELTDHLAVEGFVADLGSAALDDGRTADYRFAGAATLLSFPDNNSGLSAYLKGGMALQHTQLSGPHSLNDRLQAFGGFGSEYQFDSGLTVRGEYEAYTQDVSWMNVSVLKRIGVPDPENLALRYPLDETLLEPQRIAQQSAPLPLLPAPLQISDDIDGDGVSDGEDQCPNSPLRYKVNAHGCPVFLGLIPDLRFASSSDALSASASEALDRLVPALIAHQNQSFVVVGYADASDGAAAQQISLSRALAVSRHLVQHGVPASRLRFAGLGVSYPRSLERGDRVSVRGIEILVPSE